MKVLSKADIIFKDLTGNLVGHVSIVPVRDSQSDLTAPLIEVDEQIAQEYGETVIQLREAERYEYEVYSVKKIDLRLRCSLAKRWRTLRDEDNKPDAGLIETGSFCGTILFELVQGEASDYSKKAIATALVDVRSLKLDYRSEYRGMLRRLSSELVNLMLDARSSSKIKFRSTFEERKDAGWFQVQLELLREVLDSSEFSSALQRIVNNPNEKMSLSNDSIRTDKPMRWASFASRQLVSGSSRVSVPHEHHLNAQLGLTSIPQKIAISTKLRSVDTAENRFVKYALYEFLTFLRHAADVFYRSAGWSASYTLACRLSSVIEGWLRRGIFSEVGEFRFAPLGSPVLQRKAGYRELLRFWLRFHTAVELTWEGGEDIFYAGQRDVATLYEYWLFFELLSWFCNKCRGGARPPISELVEGLEDNSPNLKLKKHSQLGPFVGVYSQLGRRLSAKFTYNRRFIVTPERGKAGSWTRRLHPDYTFSFWPEVFTEDEAEREELMVHIHFDAKYRVEQVNKLFGGSYDNDVDDEVEGNYKRQDLLKMHAYRDAIKRSYGAYVIYPGHNSENERMACFHELLPGLGAFAVVPGHNGDARGFGHVEKFLEEILVHLSNRATSLERLSFHIADIYSEKGNTLEHYNYSLCERTIGAVRKRAFPPAEHVVLVACCSSGAELSRMLDNNEIYIELGDAFQGWRMPINFSTTRHILLKIDEDKYFDGLLMVNDVNSGINVVTSNDLERVGFKHMKKDYLHAKIQIIIDPAFRDKVWKGSCIQDVLTSCAIQSTNEKVVIPATLTLLELMKNIE